METVQKNELLAKQTNSTAKAGKWEIDTIGEFLLELYHRQIISPRKEWYIHKHKMRSEFQNFCEKTKCLNKFILLQDSTDIGYLLRCTNYLINTARGSEYYRIKSVTFFQYRNQKLKEYDESHMKRIENAGEFANGDVSNDIDYTLFSDTFDVEDSGKSYKLEYQGSEVQIPILGFEPTNFGCYICQKNFSKPELYEQHVEYHGDATDFEALKTMSKLKKQFCSLSYMVCKNMQYFCFSLESEWKSIVIDKIVIVHSRSMHYVHNSRVPFQMPSNGKETFYVNLHQFASFVEYPIIIVFHIDDQKSRVIEQFHLMRREDYPWHNIELRPSRIPNRTLFKPVLSVPHYLPPPEIRESLRLEFPLTQLCVLSNDFNDYYSKEKTYTQQNVKEAMQLLLQVEDVDSLEEYRKLTQRNVQLRKYGKEFSLKLQTSNGIYIESVLCPFDEVLIIKENGKKPINPDDLFFENIDDLIEANASLKIYTGVIQRVSNGRITFECNTKVPENTYMLVFRPARRNIRYQYRALEMLDFMLGSDANRFLFPQRTLSFMRDVPFMKFKLVDDNITNNPEQLQAVQNIVRTSSNDATFLIFGPPGTGKTTTIVEAILQLYLRRPDTKILITAGSNSACDEVALRLCTALNNLKEWGQVLARVYSRTNERRIDNISEVLLESSNLYGAHFYPAIEVLHEYRIVVCTLSVIGKLATGRFGKKSTGTGVFTHVFVDEAAASTEAETLMGVMPVLTSTSTLILSGDHKQLGPQLCSKRAEQLGLSVSLFERLLGRECYGVDGAGNYDRTKQTRLCRNYRSHPAIVKLYSSMYYNNELLGLASLGNITLCEKWHWSPNPNYPIIFHAVFGLATRDRNSSSLYNTREIDEVMSYVKDLMYFGINGEKISQSDIGIISPYKRQYQLIQEELNMRNWSQIETGSVEIFQGKEKQIIIVSFVRSFTSTIGFLENPRRLNVTLSRPKSLLILIGNPKTLSINPDFKHVIDECQRNNTIVGATIYPDGLFRTNKERSDSNKKENISKPTTNQNQREKNNKGDEKSTQRKIGLKLKQSSEKTHDSIIASQIFESTNEDTLKYTRQELRNILKKHWVNTPQQNSFNIVSLNGSETSTSTKNNRERTQVASRLVDDFPKTSAELSIKMNDKNTSKYCDDTSKMTSQLKSSAKSKILKQASSNTSTVFAENRNSPLLNSQTNTLKPTQTKAMNACDVSNKTMVKNSSAGHIPNEKSSPLNSNIQTYTQTPTPSIIHNSKNNSAPLNMNLSTETLVERNIPSENYIHSRRYTTSPTTSYSTEDQLNIRQGGNRPQSQPHRIDSQMVWESVLFNNAQSTNNTNTGSGTKKNSKCTIS